MGLPARLIAACNANDAMHRVLSTGVLRGGRRTLQTASPSMDIQMPYNMWRLLYVASGGDGEAVLRWQRELSCGTLQLPTNVVAWLSERVGSVSVSDEETLELVRAVRAQSGYITDPHTAVGIVAARRSPFATPATASEPLLCLGCAHAVKFLPSVSAALGCAVDDLLEVMPERSSHRCVGAVGRMASEVSAAQPVGSAGRPRAGQAPAGCKTVFREGENWERRLRALIENVTARSKGEFSSPSAQASTSRARL